ncbi:hypothetical protein NP493_238g00006 [Ridgeia piscesae]|uniref:Cadherin domain-containing protein n=1 Tax=Ridgeia piscesae TaxID=27915 RepID=A0AAD9UDI7_RIDPI|nr:hypothetical protein NP493_238g00006 [Ridgeia piscesae]
MVAVVTPVNEFDPAWATFIPAWTSATTPYDVDEDVAVGTSVVKVAATDADDGNDGDVTFSIASVTADDGSSGTNKFRIDSASGVVSTTGALERDGAAGKAYYDIALVATDGGASPRTTARTLRVGVVNINDNTPTFSQSVYEASIAESQAGGTSVALLAATDGDVTSSLSYDIADGNAAGKFQFSGSTAGLLETSALIKPDSPDSDPASYTLTVTVVDGGSPELTGTATVYVTVTTSNDHSPVFGTTIPTGTVTLAENSAVAYSVATVVATDNDYGNDGDITYTIASGDSGSNFQVNSVTGLIEIKKPVDFEGLSPNPIPLKVIAVDGGSSARTTTVAVDVTVTDVNDNVPVCTQAAYAVLVAENVTVGFTVVDLNCPDADVGDTVTYAILSGNTANVFSIDANGVLKTATLVDYDSATTSYDLVIRVSDSINNVDVPVSVSLSPVNEATPAFSQSPKTISTDEDTAVGTVLDTFVAADSDYAPHAIVSYSMTEAGGGTGPFSIDQLTAKIRLSSSLDYETKTSYVITVVATDGGGSQQPPVARTPSPVIPSPYAIASGNVPDRFQFSGSTAGLLETSALIKPDSPVSDPASYTLTVTVVDGGSPELTGTATVYVTVTTSNDHSPVFGTTIPTGTVTMAESSSVTHSVATVVASDNDYGNDGDVTYSIESGDAGNNFQVNSVTGLIELKKPVDFEGLSPNPIPLKVIAVDGGSSARTTTVAVDVTVTDVNDNVPVCTQAAYVVLVAENVAVGFTVVDLDCPDADVGDTVTYAILSGNTANVFSIDANGVLKTAALVDYDSATTSYDLVIRVSDSTNNVDVPVSVSLSPVNEATPTFSQSPKTISASEDTAVGTVLDTFVAADSDYAPHAIVSYSMTEAGGGTGPFSIDQSTAAIRLSSSLDYETKTSYVITVVATDGGGSQSVYDASVAESQASGTSVAQLAATDGDVTSSLSYAIASGNVPDRFQFSGSTAGLLETSALIKPDSPDSDPASYTLTVTVVDGGSPELTGTATVYVTVTTSNDHSPVFGTTIPTGTITMAESSSVTHSVATVVASDNDYGNDGDVTYSIESGDTGNNFQVNSVTGLIELKKPVDFEGLSPNPIPLKVIAVDGGSSARTTTVAVDVTVTDVNDNVPVCTQAAYAVLMAENVTVGFTVVDLDCPDADVGDTVTYAILSGNTANVFSIDVNGVLKTATLVDYDSATTSYDLVIRVSDSTNNVDVPVSVSLSPVNEATPTFSQSPKTISTSEDTAVGTVLDTFVAADSDYAPHAIVSYSMTEAGGGTGPFSIDQSTAKIRLSSSLDYETKTSYVITVVATDGGGSQGTGTLTVSVTNVNDNTPTFSQSVYDASVAESQASGTSVAQLAATDGDVTSSLSYAIASGNVPDRFQFRFPTNRNIYNSCLETRLVRRRVCWRRSALIKPDSPDSDPASYTLTVTVVDGGSPELTGTATVYVTVTTSNDHSPVFGTTIPTGTISMAESSSVTHSVATVVASDNDYGKEVTSRISIESGDTGNNFQVNSVTGLIELKKPVDFEGLSPNPIPLKVIAVDGGSSARTATVAVDVTVTDVNDNVPVCTQAAYALLVAENVAVGFTVVDLDCPDADVGDTVTYAILSGNTANVFSIDVNGVLKTATLVDYDSATTAYELVIRISDSTNNVDVPVSVSLSPVNEATPTFSQSPKTISASEDTAVGTALDTFVAADSDYAPHAIVSYSMTEASGGTGPFSIDQLTATIRLSSSLDYETKTSYVITVVATDGGGSQSVYDASVAESQASGTSVAQLAATDGDVTSSLSYAIASGNVPDRFQFSGSTAGLLETNALIKPDSPDSDPASYTLTVTVVDGGSPELTGTATVYVTVTTSNDHSPIFGTTIPTGTITMAESSSVTHSVATVVASDNDYGKDGDVTYSIESGDTGNNFQVNSVTGLIELKKPVDFEGLSPNPIPLKVIAVDGGSSARTTTVAVDVTVTDVNDNVPVCTQAAYVVLMAENVAVGFTVVDLDCPDADVGDTVTYAILSGNTANVFSIDVNGVLKTATLVDYDSVTTSYDLVIRVSDSTNNVDVPVSVSLSPVNEATPTFSQSPKTISTDEDTAVGTVLDTFVAADSDYAPHAIVSYSMTEAGGGIGPFSIDQSTAKIRLSSSLDYETKTSYVITVVATDGGGSQGTGTLTVSVTNVNDNTPTFSQSVYDASVAESQASGTSVAQLAATDGDVTSSLSYAIASGNVPDRFQFSGSTAGLLETNALIKPDAPDSDPASYTLTVTVVDGGSPELTGTATVYVTVTTSNDHSPIFGTTIPTGTISMAESSSVTHSVATVVASDNDYGKDGDVTYSIESGDTGNNFQVNSVTGLIELKKPVDFEGLSPNPIPLKVIAVDGGNSARTTTVAVDVTVTDVNDNVPVCTQAAYAVLMAENVAVGFTVVDLDCPDADVGDTVTYAILSGNTANVFSIDVNGVLKTATLVDYDSATTSYDLVIRASDSTNNVDVPVSVSLSPVNEATPAFSQSPKTISTSEDTAVGTVLDTFVAADSDYAPHAIVSYSMTEAGGGTGPFSIDQSTAAIRLSSSLDYETKTSYVITVVATDGGGSQGTGTLTVSVTNVNDNTPTFSQSVYEASVAESQAIGTSVAQLAATDGDVTSSLSYAIASGNVPDRFQFSGSTAGLLETSALIKPDAPDSDPASYTLTVTVVDGGSPELTGTATVYVTVTTSNDHSPVFGTTIPTGTISVS